MKLLIYQVLPRLYGNRNTTCRPGGSKEENGCGKMADFTMAQLNRIREFGFTHIWYTGLLEHATQTDYSSCGIAPDHPAVVKGKAGSPYAIKDYYDIDPDLAENPEKRQAEFDSLVRRTHRAGLKMIIDFVPNHVARQYHSDAKPDNVRDLGEDDDTELAFSPQNNFYYIPRQSLHTSAFDIERIAPRPYREYPAKATGNDRFDTRPQRNDWYETVKLNYGLDYVGGHYPHYIPTPSTWQKMLDILLFWAGRGIDGFRCDMAEMVPVEFWEWALPQVKEKYKKVIFIAEVYNPDRYRDYLNRGHFNYLYDKVGLYDTLRAVICGRAPAAAITGCWQAVDDILPHMLNFLENHDEQRIASTFFAGDAKRALPALLVSACLNTSPFMLYAGQEVGEPGMEQEGFSGLDGRTTIFDYWSVDKIRRLYESGENALSPSERELYTLYKQVITLCRENSILREGVTYDLMYVNYDRQLGFNPDCHFAFLRKYKQEVALCVANFSTQNCRIGVRIPLHAFEFLSLRSGMRSACDLLTGDTQTLLLRPDDHVHVDVPATGGVLLHFHN